MSDTKSTSIAPSNSGRSKDALWRHPGGRLVEEGPQSLKQHELLAVLIGSGVPGRPAVSIANAILDEYVGLYGIHQRATAKALMRIRGLGRRKAERVLAAIELGRRLYLRDRRINSPSGRQVGLFWAETAPAAQIAGPEDAELFATIIGSGVQGCSSRAIADALLQHFGGFAGLFGRDMGDFLKIRGLNSVKIIRIAAALEVAKRIANALS